MVPFPCCQGLEALHQAANDWWEKEVSTQLFHWVLPLNSAVASKEQVSYPGRESLSQLLSFRRWPPRQAFIPPLRRSYGQIFWPSARSLT